MAPRSRSEVPLAERLRADLLAHLTRRGPRRATGAHLKRLVAALERGVEGQRSESALCEAALLVRLLKHRALVDVEVPTHRGRHADFRVEHAGNEFYLHVKRWSGSGAERATLRVPQRVRELEEVPRPYLVGVRWPIHRAAMDRFLAEAGAFLMQASVGDELVTRSEDGAITGGMRVLAPWPGERVVLTVGLDAASDGEALRLERLFRKACGQFMPSAVNVIVVCGGHPGDERIVDTALLGSHVERWDLFPPRGQRVAHGRADDGFWSGGRFPSSRLLVWSPWNERRGLGAMRLWQRERSPLAAALRELLR